MAGYDKVVLLGCGSYGKVWLVDSNSLDKEQMVLKEINLKGLGDRDIKQVLMEVTILAKCSHVHIIGYTEAFVNRKSTKLSIIMDYASGGDLHKQITQRKGLYFPNETVLCWFSQLLSALSYIHTRGILHRDIKPQNLFLDERHVLKLGDFGISRILHGDADVAVTFVGTPFYLSPEICNQQPYSFKSDMWSAGCVLYELCCLRVPFTAVNLPSLITQIQTGLYTPLPSDLLCDLVCSLLTSDPEARLSADDILHLPALQKHLQEERCRTSSELSEEEQMNYNVRGRQHTKCRNRIKVKRRPELRDAGCAAESSSEREHHAVWQEQDYEGDVCSSTYTVVRHPKVRHLTFASPELSAVLARQRTMFHEGQRAFSADAPRVTRSKRHKSPPRQSLFHSVQQMKNGSDDSDNGEDSSCGVLENVAETIYTSIVKESRLQGAATATLNYLQRTLGKPQTEALVAAVNNKIPYNNLQKIFNLQPSHVLTLLWYVHLSESL